MTFGHEEWCGCKACRDDRESARVEAQLSRWLKEQEQKNAGYVPQKVQEARKKASCMHSVPVVNIETMKAAFAKEIDSAAHHLLPRARELFYAWMIEQITPLLKEQRETNERIGTPD